MRLARLLLSIPVFLLAIPAGFAAQKSKDLGAIWCVGDSITQSNADGDPGDSPRRRLYDLLKKDGYTFTFTGDHATPKDDGMGPLGEEYMYHSGYSGSVVKNGGHRVDMSASLPRQWSSGRLAKVKPDIVLIMLGTNDVDVGKKPETIASDLTDYVKAIAVLAGDKKPRFVISTIAPNRSKPSAKSDEPATEARIAATAAYNRLLPDVVGKLKTAGLDARLTDSFTPLEKDYANLMRPDNLHPNAKGDEVIAEAWLSAIKSL